MKLKTKFSLLTLLFVLTMLVLMAGVSFFSFKHFALTTAKEHARSAAEVVRVSMTEAMINGVINQRHSFLSRIAEIDGLQQARVLRGPNVNKQFKPSSTELVDAIEQQVLTNGQAYFQLEDDTSIFRATIPYIATDQGNPNCLQCHEVALGSVLGAVTITISIESLQTQATKVLTLMIGFLTLVSLIFWLLFRRQISPIIETAQGVQEVVQKARLGEFSGRINYQGNDEVAQIAKDLNRLMSYLDERLGETCRDVAELMKYELPQNIDLLQTTTEMVAGLVDVSHFKQEIAEDQTTEEVYERISRALQDQFKIGRFSLYEIESTQNRMIPAIVDGQHNAACRWCDPTILSQASACRALRTGNIIDSVAHPHICNRFNNNGQQNFQHICLPIIHSGTVGSVVQLVFNGEFSEQIYRSLPLILVYLRESSSVVEAKRLMNALRETTLRDAMTGLRNRRFLEEYISTLVATAGRKEQKLSVLMMDLDKFKSVNDTYGHDAGDIVLKSLAKTLQAQVRASDMVIRYGGEEFLVILQDSGDEGYCGEVMAEKVRAAVEKLEIQLPGTLLQKTISIGVAHFPEDSSDFWQAVKQADTALYVAKHSGRNKVIRWTKQLTVEDDDKKIPPK